jgi:hypothetical protein
MSIATRQAAYDALPAALGHEPHDDDYALADAIHDAIHDAILEVKPRSLRESWSEVEARLPKDWRVGILPERLDDGAKSYRVVALAPEHGKPELVADGPTLARALRNLAARLSGDPSEERKDG